MINPHYKFSDSENTRVTEISVGVVSKSVRFKFDQPFIVPPKAELELNNGEWFLIQFNRWGGTRTKQEGMWKDYRN